MPSECMSVPHAGLASWVQGQWQRTGQETMLPLGLTSGDYCYLTSLQVVGRQHCTEVESEICEKGADSIAKHCSCPSAASVAVTVT